MAASYSRYSDVPMEDYFGEAITGLARAKRDWDPTRGGCSFKTFIILKVKNALNEYRRKHNSIVVVPNYVRVANTYITNIKTLMEGYGIPDEYIEKTLVEGEQFRDRPMADVDSARITSELKKLKKLAKNSQVNYDILVTRAEFVPSDMSYDESMGQEALDEREKQRLAAALVVSKLEDHMTEEELHVAHGIMAGQSYGEIGRTHEPKRSIAWVMDKVKGMREKFKPERN
jgi:DNA-directed RNA polymerase specialized sigma subunit